MTTLPETKACKVNIENEWLTISFNQPEKRNALTSELTDDIKFIKDNYEKLRVGRTNAIKRLSRYKGYINHLGNPILKSLRNFMLKNTDIAMRRTKNIYNYEPLRIINNL